MFYSKLCQLSRLYVVQGEDGNAWKLHPFAGMVICNLTLEYRHQIEDSELFSQTIAMLLTILNDYEIVNKSMALKSLQETTKNLTSSELEWIESTVSPVF